MNFNSLQYLIYLPIVVLVYFLLPHKVRWIWLLIASYFFYMVWSWIFGILILVTTVISYICSLLIEKYPKHKKIFLIITLIVSLGILFIFKYLQFTIDNVVFAVNLFGGKLSNIELNLILPVGISFYTFQTLSYVIDVYRGNYKAEHHFGYYALFVSFFPQLVAGPIEKTEDLLPQLKAEHHFNKEDLLAGIRFILLGFFRKICIGDLCGIFVNNIFSSLTNASSLTVLIGGLLFALQMYGDFAGYSEIAMGSARILGIKLTKNFDQPYLSLTYGEFFHRWHYSLNRWFTQYVYIPLGGNKKGKVRKLLNVIVVFVLCGLWHGAKWTYIIWGLYAAFWICFETLFLNKILEFFKNRNVNIDSAWFKFVRHIIIMFLFAIAAIFFRATSLNDIGIALTKLFTSFDTPMNMVSNLMNVSTLTLPLICILLLNIFIMHYSHDFAFAYKEEKQWKNILPYLLLLSCIVLCWIGLLQSDSVSSFAYFQF